MNPFDFADVGSSDVEVTRLGLGGAPLSGMILADGTMGGGAVAVQGGADDDTIENFGGDIIALGTTVDELLVCMTAGGVP